MQRGRISRAVPNLSWAPKFERSGSFIKDICSRGFGGLCICHQYKLVATLHILLERSSMYLPYLRNLDLKMPLNQHQKPELFPFNLPEVVTLIIVKS